MARRTGRWRSREARAAFEARYAEAMRLLPAPRETVDLPTGWGTVRAYTFGERVEGRGPVVMCPGRSSGAPMWATNLPALCAEREVVLFDAIGDTGLSEQTRPFTSIRDQADYVAQMFDALAVGPAHLVGHSFGGALATATALHHPDRLASLALLEPVFVLGRPRAEILLLSLPASLPFLPRSWREAGLARIGGQSALDREDPLAAMIAAGSEGFHAELPVPRPLTDAQLAGLRPPLLLAMAERSVMGGATRAVERARAHVPVVEAAVWPGTTHSLPMEAHERLDRALLDFFRRHDGPPRA